MILLPQLADASTIITGAAGQACGNACSNGSISVIFTDIANTLIFLVGSVSVIMIIVGGLRYAISNGDAKATEGAKNTILYSVIGVIVAIASYAIVQFITGSIK
jgi:hypothetical protein